MTEGEGFGVEVDRDRRVVHLRGDIDLVARDAVAAALGGFDHLGSVTIDLGGVTFIDSSGLTVLVDAAVTGPGVTIRDASPTIVRIIEATGLDQTLAIEP
jgi:anti-sigma B factor antagonist